MLIVTKKFNNILSINGLSPENRLRLQQTPKKYKIKVTHCKLIDLLIRIELTRAILMLWFSNFMTNLIIHFRMFLYLEIYFLRVTVSLICRLQAISSIHVLIYPDLISEGIRNCSTLWPAQHRNRDSQATCYQIKKHANIGGRISQKIWESIIKNWSR